MYIKDDNKEETMEKLKVLDNEISVKTIDDKDFISLTDMLKSKDGEFFISDWLRNRNTIEFLGVWESMYNPDFNYGEFAIIKSSAGLNSYKISVKEWCAKTNAIGLKATAGRYGGTYAQSDIAYEFASWISVEFKLYLIKEFQRLKLEEQKRLGWDVRRELTKINYLVHTDSIKENLIPTLNDNQKKVVYASEADLLNVALFGKTAGEWRNENPKRKGNIRDYATIEQLLILANLEVLNAEYIEAGMAQSIRLEKLNKSAVKQLESLQKRIEVSKVLTADK
jgi:hypothetical protein